MPREGPDGLGGEVRPDLLSAGALSAEGWGVFLEDAARLKAEWRATRRHAREPLRGQAVALVFEHPSLRTRISTELAIRQLGGDALYLVGADVGLGRRESAADIARTLDRWVAAIVARTIHHATLLELAEAAAVPVVNGLTDREHPLQAAADVLTIHEAFGAVAGQTIAFIGDGNNVSASLAIAVTSLGGHMRLATPAAYRPASELLDLSHSRAAQTGGSLVVLDDPRVAAEGAAILYTDVWTSMGQEGERDVRRRELSGFTIDADLLAIAPPHALVMHCLPAQRGEEISASVLEGPRSLVPRQVENRLHATKAILAGLLSYPEA